MRVCLQELVCVAMRPWWDVALSLAMVLAFCWWHRSRVERG